MAVKWKWVHPTTIIIDGVNKSHPIYTKWKSMKYRCYNTKNAQYHDYGGRGIDVCNEWLCNYDSFYIWCILNGYDKSLQIDRIDNNKGYYPDNCRFTTMSENYLNRRSYGIIKYRGVTYYHNRNKYKVSIKIGKLLKFIGYYDTAECAALAYNEYVIKHNINKKLNIIE